jgi:hypothetical protein
LWGGVGATTIHNTRPGRRKKDKKIVFQTHDICPRDLDCRTRRSFYSYQRVHRAYQGYLG